MGNDSMEDKIGVFICAGYGIAEAIDVDALCKVVNDECKVPICRIWMASNSTKS